MRPCPLFDPLAWVQAGIDAMDVAMATAPRLRTPLLRDQVQVLQLPKLCAQCPADPCAKRRSEYLQEAP